MQDPLFISQDPAQAFPIRNLAGTWRLLLTMLPFAHAILQKHPEQVPGARIAPWNGHRGAFTLTFDDGNDAQVTFAPTLLSSYGINATFFITPQFMDPPDDDPVPMQLEGKCDLARNHLLHTSTM